MALPQALRATKRTLSCPLILCRDTSWMRMSARLALASWFLPLLLSVLAAFSTPAQAQAQTQTVVVLDFAVSSGIDPLLGRKAADGLAVELQRSGDYEVVPRARVEEAVGTQAGLQPPFNDTAQVRLAQAVGARSVFSGRVVSVEVTNGQVARVRVEVKQLDSNTGDYVNGTQILESTEQKLQPIANEVLVDEAINKAVFAAVRSMKQTTLPEGTVLNTTANDVELSIGARNGVAIGQRYTVLRDVYNKAKQITERVKIGEIRISRVEADQAVGVLSAGGQAGVRTGDRIRQIFEPVNYPVTSTGSGTSVTPVTAPPVTSNNSGGVVKKAGRGALGLLALAALVGLAGFGGGGGGGNPNTEDVVDFVADSDTPYATIQFKAGLTGANIFKSLQNDRVVGFIIYRGESPGFSPAPSNIQGFVDGTSAPSGSASFTFQDAAFEEGSPGVAVIREQILIEENNDGGDDDDDNNTEPTIDVERTPVGVGTDSLTRGDGNIEIEYTQRPLVIGRHYYYKVQRIDATRTQTDNGGDDDDDDDTGNDIQINLKPQLSNASGATGRYTPLLRPRILQDTNGYDLDNFIVRVDYDQNALASAALTVRVPAGGNVGTGVDEFRVQVSTNSGFPENNTFTSQAITPPNDTNADGVLDLDLGAINVPGLTSTTQSYFIRVQSRSNSDSSPKYHLSNRVEVPVTAALQVKNSRFLSSTAQSPGGINIGRSKLGRAAGGVTYGTPRILKPK